LIHQVCLADETDLDGWRSAARELWNGGVAPEAVAWSVLPPLFASSPVTPTPTTSASASASARAGKTAPRLFLQLAASVLCHRSPERFALLYRLLWRIEAEPRLLALTTDPDVAQALAMDKAVRRAAHKMKAFVRFRLVEGAQPETFLSWFEPVHHVARRTAPFFVDRFANMRFSILTPDISVHWSGEALNFGPGASRADAPLEDAVEDDWRAYYASIFNPARLKVRAMQSEMPKRYWRNLPEAALIPALIEQARERTHAMVEADPTQPRKRAPRRPDPVAEKENPDIGIALRACRRCELWRGATQAVRGEGPQTASLMLVGEQPGDQEDLAGRPFVGPAGQVLDKALAEAGLVREQIYITNAVKHFKNEPRGKRRLHRTPTAGEVVACRWWLGQERAALAPRVILALGATAAHAVLGRPVPIHASRGQAFDLGAGTVCLVTVHPAYILRLPDALARTAAHAHFVRDLRLARGTLEGPANLSPGGQRDHEDIR
jgi:probable DNA metabolism protein